VRLFDDARYAELAQQYGSAYNVNDPFPHTVIDNFLPIEVAERILGEFPDSKQINWLRFDRQPSQKPATKEDRELGDFTRELLTHMNSAACLRFLEQLTGIKGLIGNPYFEGGGLHQIERGGFLKMHVDFNYYRRLQLDRRINLIVYANKDWQEEYNGHLQLWDREMKGCVKKILPVFNRCVIFNTTGFSWHGHPDRLECPGDRTRKSMALYYYTNGRPEEEKGETHGTVWQERQKPGVVKTAVAKVLQTTARVIETPTAMMRKAATALTVRKAG